MNAHSGCWLAASQRRTRPFAAGRAASFVMSRSADPAELVPGRVIASKYRLEQPIGRGGMGIVFRATHLELSFNVAIKVLTTDVDSLEARERFLREARSAAQIRSEHAARVFDFGSLPSGAPFIVMECLEGVNLRQFLRQRGKATPEQAVSFVIQACRAVAEAHGLGIVHRDIKPSNLFLCERDNAPPVVKVLDFGISKTLGAVPPSSTTTGAALVGSPQYMSPERLRSPGKIDATVDVWAFGAVLYELLSGAPAFSGETVPALLASIVADDPVPLVDRCPAVSPQITHVVEKCLQKDPSKRYANALELLQALAINPEQPAVNSHQPQPRLEPGSSDNTRVQPGFADTTLMLSPSDIELLSEPQPATTTTIEPITKDTTSRTSPKAVQLKAGAGPTRGRWLVFAGVATAAVVVGGAVLRLNRTENTPHVEQQTDALRPAAAASTLAPTRTVDLPIVQTASLEALDQRPLPASDRSENVQSLPPSLETKRSQREVRASLTSKPGRHREAKALVDAPKPSPPSSARKPKKSAETELFSDIH